MVGACVAELVGTARESQNLIAAFLARAAQDPEFVEEGLRLRRKVSSKISALLLLRRDQIHHPDPELSLDLGVQFAFGLVLQSVVFGGTWAGGRSLGDAALEREIARSFLAYIGVAPIERSAS
jgi:hypothetical protein